MLFVMLFVSSHSRLQPQHLRYRRLLAAMLGAALLSLAGPAGAVSMYTVTALGTLGGSTSTAFDISASGQVVGSSNTSAGTYHAVLYDGTLHDLGTLGGLDSEAYGIDVNGQVVGYSLTAGNAAQHAFRYDASGMRDLGTLLGFPFSSAYGINTSGQVVGRSYVPGVNASRAFLYDASGMHDLNSLLVNAPVGLTLSDAQAINDLGQIVANGNDLAYLLTPTVPLPAADWLLLGGMGLLGGLGLRHQS